MAAGLAKVHSSQSYSRVAGDNIQVHGGIGFTWEHPAHLYFKRAKACEAMFGTPAYHRELLATALGGVRMDIEIRAEDRSFRDEVRRWLDKHLVSEFAAHRGVGGPDDAEAWGVRLRWEKELSSGRWLGLTWPTEYGGRGASLA